MSRRVHRPGVRAGYDEWAQTYDATANPLIALDRRYTIDVLRPGLAERILDAGCGTGAHLCVMRRAGSLPTGLDFSRGMLHVAQRRCPGTPLVQADLNDRLPVQREVFDAALCALVGEHLTDLPLLFSELYDSLLPGGRLVFSVFHPEMAAAGIEANFEREGVEYRLGAEPHRVDDYLNVIDDCGFRDVRVRDDALVAEVPWSTKYLGRALMLTCEARKAA